MHLYILALHGESHMMVHHFLRNGKLGVAICRHLFSSLGKRHGFPACRPHPHVDVSRLPAFRIFIQSGQCLSLEDAGRKAFFSEDFSEHCRIVLLPSVFVFHLLHQQFPRHCQFHPWWLTSLLSHGLLHPTIPDSGQRMVPTEFEQDFPVLPFGRYRKLLATV